jgi:hypothetical protein
LAFSNDMIPITLSSDDRRWFVIWSTARRMDPVEAQVMWRWYKDEGGFESIARWLYARNVTAFNPGAAPPMTDVKESLVEHSMSMAESVIVDMVRSRQGEFARGVIGGPFHAVCDRLQALMPAGAKVPQAALLHAIQEAGWIDMGRLHSVKYNSKRHIFAAPEIAEANSKSDLRRMIEEPSAPKVVDIKLVK